MSDIIFGRLTKKFSEVIILSENMKIIIIILISLAALFILYLIAVNNIIRKNKITLFSEKLPSEFDGYKISFLSDLHDSYLGRARQKKLVKKTAGFSPDVIFLGGDMHEKKENDSEYFSLLASLGKIAPLYFVDGNHENKLKERGDYKNYLSEFNKYVFNLNGKTELWKSGAKINLYGCGYFEYEKERFDFDKTSFSVFLYHSPFVFDDLESLPDLMLSGHVHGGIIELPFLGAVFSPGVGKGFFERFKPEFFFPKYYKNTYKKGNSVLAVGRGIGNFKYCPLRFIPSEILEITLRKKG